MNKLKKNSVAILGVTGYIGRALLNEIHNNPEWEVVGYSRDVDAAINTLASYNVSHGDIKNYEELLDNKYDVLVNVTGIGSPKKLHEDLGAVFAVTEEMDRVVFQYLDKYPDTRTFNISSGAVYGISSGDYVGPNSIATFAVNSLNLRDSYALAKLHSEGKHRARSQSSIVDLRVFAFVSRYLDASDLFLISEIAHSLKKKTSLKTNSVDLVRDFTTAGDLVAVLKFLVGREPVNDVFDMRSKEPLSKLELLHKLKEELGLTFEVEEMNDSSPTGVKNVYAPTESRLESLGYSPQYSSTESVMSELKAFLTL